MKKLLQKVFKKHSNIEEVSAAEQGARDFLNMSEEQERKMMERVARRASEDQLKILRS